MKDSMIKLGDFFFRYRNRLFPVIMVVLYFIAPPPQLLFGSSALHDLKDIVAVLIAFAGLVLRGLVVGYAYIKRGGVDKKVYAENLVTQGMFTLCRNPLYVGNMLIYAGVFLAHGAPLVVLLGVGCFAFLYQCIIFAEERYLREKFGAGYDDYCKDTPRWGVKLSRFKKATEDMAFNFRKVIIKDYPTMTVTVIMLALTKVYELLYPGIAEEKLSDLYTLIGVIIAAALIALFVRTLKKTGVLTDKGANA